MKLLLFTLGMAFALLLSYLFVWGICAVAAMFTPFIYKYAVWQWWLAIWAVSLVVRMIVPTEDKK